MQKTIKKRAISWLLLVAMLLTLMPTMLFNAGAAEVMVSSEAELKSAIESAASGSDLTIKLNNSIELSTKLTLDKNLQVYIVGNGYKIEAGGSAWVAYGESQAALVGSENWVMINVKNGSFRANGLTLDALSKTSILNVDGSVSLFRLTDCTIQNGSLDTSGYSAGVSLRTRDSAITTTINIDGCTFQNNVATGNASTSGGALYVGYGWNTYITNTTFQNNSAHSGGALYSYMSLVRTSSDVKFINNTAGQRGGAIHSHGNVYVLGSEFTGNSSEQYGGTIYISSNYDSTGAQQIGVALLDNVEIKGSTAGTAGGAVYVADFAELQVVGNTTIRDNTVNDGSVAPYDQNNVYVSTSTGKVVVYGEITSGNAVEGGGIGVSTGNPYTFKDLVYSATTSIVYEGINYSAYDMSTNPTNYDKFTFDGEGWTLVKNEEDNQKMYLITQAAGDSGTVIFDFNVPGAAAQVEYMKTIGESVTVPTVTTQTIDGVTFRFVGWFDAAEGGTQLTTSTTEVVAGVKTYYAQWVLDTSGGGGGSAGTGDMYLVYFDYNLEGTGVTSAYSAAGTFSWTVTVDGESKTYTAKLPFAFPDDPYRPGYTFVGWGETYDATTPIDSSWIPSKTTTLYGIWIADSHTLTWNANGGTGSTTTTQDYATVIETPSTSPQRTGYTFEGWYLDADCSAPLVSGTKVKGDQTFYAKWIPIEYTITWNTDYTGGAITTTQQDYDQELIVMTDPVREGFVFGGWYTEQNGQGTRAESYGTVDGNINFYAYWTQNVMDYTVTLEWDDASNNDNVRPDSVTVELLRNGLATGFTYTLTAADAIGDGNTWEYTFRNVETTDKVSNEYVYSVSIISSVSSEYEYKGDFTSQNVGYILLSHDLITIDVDTYIVWDDNSDQDGYRPTQVTLQLFADGVVIDDATTTVIVPAGTGNTWTHVFEGMQRYRKTDSGRTDIVYTIKVTETISGSLSEYTTTYTGGTNQTLVATMHHEFDTVSKKVVVEWNDNNNQDNARPSSMTVQLYADGEPVVGKYVTLSDANNWTYTWGDLAKYSTSGNQILYSVQVTSTLTDYTAKSTEMTIEMTYVPSSTSIPVFLTWVDGNDVDGLRPEIVEAELYADGVATGAKQKLSATNNWITTWTGYPIYKDGQRIDYTVVLTSIPNGYEAEYIGIYDKTGLSITLTHDRIRATQTGSIIWDDNDNLAGARMSSVNVMLYADGSPMEAYTATLTAENNWSYDFENMPVYRDGGEEIKYSIYVTSAKGDYTETGNGLTVTLHYQIETVDVPLTIIWADNDNADSTRPVAVAVYLTIDGVDTKYVKAATASSNWAVSFDGLAKYESGSVGQLINYGVRVDAPSGYTATMIGDTVVLKATAETADVYSNLYWKDNDDQYGDRPDKVTVKLYADYHNGNSAVSTGKNATAKESNGYEVVFSQVPVNANGYVIEYSVQVSGDLSDYNITYDGLDVYLTHKSIGETDYTKNVDVKVTWNDNSNAYNSRPETVDVVVNADGDVYKTYTLDISDIKSDNSWSYTFENLPTYIGGKEVAYTVDVANAPSNYKVSVNGNNIKMTHVRDLVVSVNWNDDHDADDKRPTEMELALYADGIATGDVITLEGHETDSPWKMTFEDVPVWGTADTTHEVVYTYLVITDAQYYTVDYHNYESVSSQLTGDNLYYTLDMTYDRTRADVTGTIVWQDDTDRDGLRPESVVVKLYADYRDGKGAVDTGLEQTVTGTNDAASWETVFEAQPVYDSQGNEIIYTLVASEVSEYRIAKFDDQPRLDFIHTVYTTTVTATVTWNHASDDAGLQEQELIAELYRDGEPTGSVIKLTNNNGFSGSFYSLYVNHDHGTPYVYSVEILSTLPDGYEVETENGTDITISHNYFTVSGTVVDSVGKLVSGAAVRAYDADGSLLMSTTTDSNGAWSFNSVPKGNITFRATKVISTSLAGSEVVTVAGSNITGVEIVLNGNSSETDDKYTYRASGRVIFSDNTVAASAEVRLFDTNRNLLQSTTTDTNGKYSFSGLTNGTYQMSVVAMYDGTSYTATSETFIVYNDHITVSDIVIQLPNVEDPVDESCIVNGLVVDSNGASLYGIIVQIKDKDTGNIVYTLVSDNEGMYEQKNVPDGEYEVIYNYAGTEIGSVDLKVDGEEEITLPTLVVDTTQDDGYGYISGIVTDNNGDPVEGADVYVYDKDGKLVGHKVTGEDGKYDFYLPNGDYTVVIERPKTEEHVVDVDDDHATGDPNENGDTVDADKYSISGIVTDSSGDPVEGAIVELYEKGVEPSVHGEKLNEMTTGEDGKYEFTDLDAGEYVVLITYPDGTEEWVQDITTEPNGEHEDVEIETKEYTVSGVVTDENGDPVEDAKVTLKDSNGNQVGEMIVTGEDGYYEWNHLPEDQYTIIIEYPTSEKISEEDVTVNGNGGGSSTEDTFVVAGKVTDQDGNLLASATVKLKNTTTNKTYSTKTNSKGVYSMAVPAGDYEVTGAYGSNSSEVLDITVKANTDNVNLVITITSETTDPTVYYTVTFESNGGSSVSAQKVADGGTVSKPTNPTRSGYTFVNWYTDSDLSTVYDFSTEVTNAFTLYAKWTKTTTSGGSGGGGGGGGGTTSGSTDTGSTTTENITISGNVTDENGNPVEGADVSVVNKDTGKEYTTTTDANGNYSVTVPQGEYTVTISYGSTTATTTVTAKENITVDTQKLELGVYVKGYIKGYPDGTFRPENNISRAEVATIIARVTDGFSESATYSCSSTDVASDAWYVNYLGFALNRGLLTGDTSGTFRPSDNITRAEFAAVVARYLGLSNDGIASFADASDHWASGYIKNLVDAGIITGYSDGTFRPNAYITRAEAVTMMNRALGREPDVAVLSGLFSNGTVVFSDVPTTHWAHYNVLESVADHYHESV